MLCAPYPSSLGEILVVSSTTRPTTFPDLYAGRYIYEADTGRTMMYDGAGWIVMDEPIQTNTTASFSGITGGTPTYSNWYRRSGGVCTFSNSVTFGGAPTIAALAAVLPVATSGVGTGALNVGFRDAGVAAYPGMSEVAVSGTSVVIYSLLATGTPVIFTAPSGTVPFSFNTGDGIFASGFFQMNTRYL